MSPKAPEDQSRYKQAGKAYKDQISEKEVPELVQSLRDAFRTEKTYSYDWRVAQLKALRRMLVERELEICQAMFGDLHKNKFEGFVTEIATTIGEIDFALDHLKEWMKPTSKGNTPLTVPAWSSTQRDPLGVVLVFGSWNYPIYLSFSPIVGAIAAGNCVLLKPGSYAVNCSNIMCDLVAEYMDPECIKCVEGNRKVTSALLEERFDKIFFTGSAFVGKIVAKAAAEHLTPCVLELGGKSPCIVDKSAADSLDFACRRIVWGCFTNCGQTCVRPDFILVDDKIKQKFISKLKEIVQEFYSKEPKSSEWFARLINEQAFKRLENLLKVHKEQIILGGESDANEKFIAPTLIDFGNDLEKFAQSEVMQDEIFGPLVPICGYSHVEQVVDFVKDLKTGKPLALYAFGTDKSFVNNIKTRTTSGGMVVNDAFLHLGNHELPFGGVGNSGMGSYHGKYSFDCFSHEKAVLEKTPKIEDLPGIRDALSMRFPPYSKQDQQMMRSVFNPVAGRILHFFTSKSFLDFAKLALLAIALKFLGFRITRD